MNYKKEIAVGGIFIIFLVGLLNPGDIFMPTMTQMALLAAATVVFVVFAALIWRERGGDERDRLHRLIADRIAFLSTASVLMLALVVQGFMHMIDPWLPISLGVMVLGKIGGLLYSKKNY